MGYPRDLDEYNHDELLDEISRRARAIESGVCPYCERRHQGEVGCKMSGNDKYFTYQRSKPQINSVLQDWVMRLPLREQGTILTNIRGCDLVPKLPLTSTARQLTGFFRYLVMNPADPREVGIEGAFFQNRLTLDWRASELGHYPQHWYSHVMHAYEVVGYRHPDTELRGTAFQVYRKLAESMHLPIESKEDMIRRLSEDRIKTGTVVS